MVEVLELHSKFGNRQLSAIHGLRHKTVRVKLGIRENMSLKNTALLLQIILE